MGVTLAAGETLQLVNINPDTIIFTLINTLIIFLLYFFFLHKPVMKILDERKEKIANDVIGLHYAIGQKMDVRKETLPDSNTGFAVEVSLQEIISRSNTDLPSENHYRVNALINQEQKIVKLIIF